MKHIKTLLLVVGCASAFFVTGCNSSNSASNTVNNNQENGDQPKKPSTPINPGLPGKNSVCFLRGCAPAVAKANIVDPKGDFKYPNPGSMGQHYRAPIAFLDLSKLSPDMRLSQDFYLKDFALATKGRYALLAPVLIRKVQALRDRLGAKLRITSGFRSPGYNRRIPGSATYSRHMWGDALDLGGFSVGTIRNACAAQSASFMLTYKDGHVHCDWRAVGLDPALFPPTKAALTTDSMVQMAINLSEQTNIQFNETADGVRLSVKLPDLELEGEPAMAWVVTSPSGKEIMFNTMEPVLQTLEEKGTYHVKVIVGDFIESEANIDLE